MANVDFRVHEPFRTLASDIEQFTPVVRREKDLHEKQSLYIYVIVFLVYW